MLCGSVRGSTLESGTGLDKTEKQKKKTEKSFVRLVWSNSVPCTFSVNIYSHILDFPTKSFFQLSGQVFVRELEHMVALHTKQRNEKIQKFNPQRQPMSKNITETSVWFPLGENSQSRMCASPKWCRYVRFHRPIEDLFLVRFKSPIEDFLYVRYSQQQPT